MFIAGILRSDGAMAARSPRVQPDGRTYSYLLHAGEPEIRITQNDVRAMQLAKAALHAGARLLMDHLGVDRVERITLAGAFGSHIEPKYAMILGLIPDCDLAKVSSAGNAAGTGARIALLNRRARSEIEQVVRRIEKIETAIEPASRNISSTPWRSPCKCALPDLASVVDLPGRSERTAAPAQSRAPAPAAGLTAPGARQPIWHIRGKLAPRSRTCGAVNGFRFGWRCGKLGRMNRLSTRQAQILGIGQPVGLARGAQARAA